MQPCPTTSAGDWSAAARATAARAWKAAADSPGIASRETFTEGSSTHGSFPPGGALS